MKLILIKVLLLVLTWFKWFTFHIDVSSTVFALLKLIKL
jgi:hypothetical protein